VSELKSLGRYQIQGVLGKGAMGLVYDAHDPKLNRRVAIKTILTRTLDEATAKHYSMRFKREVRAVARLNHPNIVQVYDFGTEGDLAYIVMEHIQGKELKDYFDSGERFDLATVYRLMVQLLEALHLAHEAGIIHRDVKPANVMIDARKNAKLTDFGVARVTDPDGDSGEATRAGAIIGTPSHMSPEQIQGQEIDRRTDIFSAGVVLYQFLTGKKPFEGTQWALAKKIIQDDPVWPSTLMEIPTALDRVIARAMAKAPEHRYQTAHAFAQALRRVSEGKPPEDPDETQPVPATAAPASSSASTVANEADLEFWKEVKDSTEPEDFELYLEQFPSGAYAALARKRVAKMRENKG
jgi:serine/threonine protein kinase